jgi:hypothetical protein
MTRFVFASAVLFPAAVLLQTACGPDDTQGAIVDSGGPDDASQGALADSGVACFPCEGYWICGGAVERVTLKPEEDGCYLSGLSGRNILAPDGTILADGTLVGTATGSGARVTVTTPDGGQWLYCAAGGGC